MDEKHVSPPLGFGDFFVLSQQQHVMETLEDPLMKVIPLHVFARRFGDIPIDTCFIIANSEELTSAKRGAILIPIVGKKVAPHRWEPALPETALSEKGGTLNDNVLVLVVR